MSAPIKKGDQVAFSAGWLRSTSTYTGDYPKARGEVTGTVHEHPGFRIVRVRWDHPDLPNKVNAANLVKVVGGVPQEHA